MATYRQKSAGYDYKRRKGGYIHAQKPGNRRRAWCGSRNIGPVDHTDPLVVRLGTITCPKCLSLMDNAQQ